MLKGVGLMVTNDPATGTPTVKIASSKTGGSGGFGNAGGGATVIGSGNYIASGGAAAADAGSGSALGTTSQAATAVTSASPDKSGGMTFTTTPAEGGKPQHINIKLTGSNGATLKTDANGGISILPAGGAGAGGASANNAQGAAGNINGLANAKGFYYNNGFGGAAGAGFGMGGMGGMGDYHHSNVVPGIGYDPNGHPYVPQDGRAHFENQYRDGV